MIKTVIYDEYFINGILSVPDEETMIMLKNSKTIKDIEDNIPHEISIKPSIIEE